MNKVIFAVALGVTLALPGCAALEPQRAPNFETLALGATAARSQRAELLYELLAGEIAGKRGMLKEAAVHYRNASEISDDVAIAERSTKIALFASDWEQALKSAERWVALQPESAEARQMAGLLYVQSKQPEKAVDQFDWIVANSGDDREVVFKQLGVTIGKDKVEPQTVKVFDLLRKKHPDSLEAQLAFARVAYRADLSAEALQGVDDALRLQPDNLDAAILRNRILLNTGNTDEALGSMASLVEKHSSSETVRLDYARMLVQAKRYPEALREFTLVMQQIPDDANLIYSTALLHTELGQHNEAREYLHKLVDSSSHRDAAHYYLGRIDETERAWEKAIAWFLRVGEGEYYYDAQASVAEMLAKLGQADKAREMLQGMRNESSSEAVKVRLYLAEAQVMRESGESAQGVEFISKALTLYPDNIELLYSRGMLAESADNLELLESDMRAILVQEPDNATALNALGYTLADRTTRYAEAYDLIKKALELRPDDAAILDSMGWIYYRLGNFAKAIEYLQKAYALLQDPEVSAHLGEVQWAAGQQQEAKETIRKALQESPEDSRLLKLQQQFDK